jgi:hypothetical protein
MLNKLFNKKQNKETSDVYMLLVRKVDGLAIFPITTDYELGYSDALNDVRNLVWGIAEGKVK